MNSWAGVYLWGLATNNPTLINLGIYGYTTQYEATKNYYLNMDGDIWQTSSFNHKSIGMLFDSSFRWSLWWTPIEVQSVMGIQVMPLTPSLLYLGYNTGYAQNFYDEYNTGRVKAGNKADVDFWRDIWLRLKSLFDGAGAVADFNAFDPDGSKKGFADGHGSKDNYVGDDGSSMSFSWHFIHFFNSLGQIDTNYYADTPSFLVMDKGGTKTYIAYNHDKNSSKMVRFYTRGGGSVGTMNIPAGAIGKTQDFTDVKYYYDNRQATSGEISAQIISSSTSATAQSLVWSSDTFRNDNIISQHYIDVSLNYNYPTNWKALIYTDNKSSVTTASVNFIGTISTYTVSGFVNSYNPARQMLPIRWRAVSSTISWTQSQLFDGSNFDLWNNMRDISSFNATLNKDSEEVRFMDERGFKWNTSAFGELPPEWKIRLYFMSDFSQAIKTDYKANIVIEYFNE
jgi:hypothetical protein